MLCCTESVLFGVIKHAVILLELKKVNGCRPFHWFHLNSLHKLMPLARVPREGFILRAVKGEGPRSLREKKQDPRFSRQSIELQSVPPSATHLLVKAPVNSHELQSEVILFRFPWGPCCLKYTNTALCRASTSPQLAACCRGDAPVNHYAIWLIWWRIRRKISVTSCILFINKFQ